MIYLRRTITVLAIALAMVLIYGLHERGLAAHYAAQASIESQDLRAQVSALTAKLDSLANKETVAPAPQTPMPPAASRKKVKAGNHQKPDPRFKKLQAQLDAQGKEIESTRQEISSARTDLEGSIARTHEELVVLEKRGERSYFEFDLDKSKNFHPQGPVGVSLRKANVKHQYADLELLVDDRQISKKHLNLYEPAVFYPTGERQAVELIINSITKNHIHGYISAPKYRASELASSSTANTDEKGQQNDPQKARRKLEVPR
jgi:hypothetical protein